MKKTLLTLACAAIASTVIAAEVTETKTKTTTTTGGTVGTGTITEYTPGTTFIVKEKTGPVTYKYGKHVTYVTKKGKTLTDDEVRTHVKVGSPVHVHYGTEGADRVIERVEIDED